MIEIRTLTEEEIMTADRGFGVIPNQKKKLLIPPEPIDLESPYRSNAKKITYPRNSSMLSRILERTIGPAVILGIASVAIIVSLGAWTGAERDRRMDNDARAKNLENKEHELNSKIERLQKEEEERNHIRLLSHDELERRMLLGK